MIMAVAVLGISSCKKDEAIEPTPVTTIVGDWEIVKETTINYSTGYERVKAPFVPVSFYEDGDLLIDSLSYHPYEETKDSVIFLEGTNVVNLRGRWEKTRDGENMRLYTEITSFGSLISKEVNLILK